MKPCNIFNLAIGTDNLFHSEKREKLALYNLLSTFSGTHFLQPRTIIARVGLVF